METFLDFAQGPLFKFSFVLMVLGLLRIRFLLIAGIIKTNALPRETFLNINLPNLPLGRIKGVEITHLGERSYGDIIEEGHDGRRTYYWIVRDKPAWEPTEGTDIWALINGKVSITPLHINLTSHSAFPPLEELSNAIFQELGSPMPRK